MDLLQNSKNIEELKSVYPDKFLPEGGGFVVRDEYQNRGIGMELLSYLTQLAKKNGLHGFEAEVLMDNKKMLQLFEKMGFVIEKRAEAGSYELKMLFQQG